MIYFNINNIELMLRIDQLMSLIICATNEAKLFLE